MLDTLKATLSDSGDEVPACFCVSVVQKTKTYVRTHRQPHLLRNTHHRAPIGRTKASINSILRIRTDIDRAGLRGYKCM